jgi:hypothetical protein
MEPTRSSYRYGAHQSSHQVTRTHQVTIRLGWPRRLKSGWRRMRRDYSQLPKGRRYLFSLIAVILVLTLVFDAILPYFDDRWKAEAYGR